MRDSRQQLLALGLVVLYGGISLLGHGLHELSPAHEHHHVHANGHSHAHTHHHHAHGHHTHGPCSHLHAHARKPAPEWPGLSDHHDCEICVFLDQIRSQAPQVASAEVAEPLIVDAATAAPQFFAQVAVGLYAPRGPPAVWG